MSTYSKILASLPSPLGTQPGSPVLLQPFSLPGKNCAMPLVIGKLEMLPLGMPRMLFSVDPVSIVEVNRVVTAKPDASLVDHVAVEEVIPTNHIVEAGVISVGVAAIHEHRAR